MGIEVKKLEKYIDIYDIFRILMSQDNFKDNKISFLDSSLKNKYGKYSIIGINPYLELKEKDNKFYINDKLSNENFEEYLDKFLKENKQENKYDLPLISGGIAYFSYDYGRKFENIKTRHKKDVDIPEAVIRFYKTYIIEDIEKQEIYISYQDKKDFDNLINILENTKIEEENAKEKRIKLVLDSIRKHNNKIVRFYLATKDNIINRQNLEDSILHRKEGVYGVNLDKKSIYEGDIELVDINAKSQDGYTPIVVAIEAKNHEILNLLIENGANLYEKHPIFNRTTLGTAAYYENVEAVQALLKKDPKLVNIGSTLDGWTPLEDATLKANVQIVKLLLQYGANPTITDKHGGTPMDMATKFGKGEIVKLLRDNIKANRKKYNYWNVEFQKIKNLY